MSLLSLQNVQVSFGAEDILIGVSGEVNTGDRIGLVGRNGAGKTTLLHVLSGELRPSGGSRHLPATVSVGLVEQIPSQPDSLETVYSEALSGLDDLIAMEQALHAASEDLATGGEAAAEHYSDLQERFEAAGGYVYHSRLAQVLKGLGFVETEWSRPVAELSGGQRTRLALARVLLQQPDLLILDEPTNHIDLDAMNWLDDFLSRWPGTLVVTSHDRYFLDKVTNRMWLLESGRVRSYRGNYSAFEKLRAGELELQKKQAEAQAEMIAREEAFIRRYRAGQKAREAKGRQKRLNRVQRIEAPVSQRATSFSLAAQRSGSLVLSTSGLSAGYEEEPLVRVEKLEVERGERIALIGANGSGKTTLLKTLTGELAPIAGSFRLGSNVSVAHYWQEGENLDGTKSVLDDLRWGRSMDAQAARNLLGRFLFSGNDVLKPVSALSGGERSRLALAKLMLEEANLLLLDEPTNHLDIPSREALEEALDSYQGTIIFVSHDRQLISTLADRFWLLNDGSLEVFDGSYAELVENSIVAKKTVTASSAGQSSERPASQGGSQQKKRLEALDKLESDIASLESVIADLGHRINAASTNGDLPAVQALGHEFEEQQERLEALLHEWSTQAD